MRLFIVSEADLLDAILKVQNAMRTRFMVGKYEKRMETDLRMHEAIARLRACPIPDWATHIVKGEATGEEYQDFDTEEWMKIPGRAG